MIARLSPRDNSETTIHEISSNPSHPMHAEACGLSETTKPPAKALGFSVVSEWIGFASSGFAETKSKPERPP
jgi:hypothetical protein